MALYLDASALVKLVVEEKESEALRAFVTDAVVTSSVLASVEVARSARRFRAERQARELLRRVLQIGLYKDIAEQAAELDPTSLSSLDAIHLATALSVGPRLDGFVVYDRRLARAARAAGLPVLAPA